MPDENHNDRVVYERVLRLRRGETVIPFTIRLENLRHAKRGINDGVAADLVVEGLGSRLDLQDDAPFLFPVFNLDRLACILQSVADLRGLLKPFESDIGWLDDGGYGWFGVPIVHEYLPPYGLEFEREIEALINERMNRRLEEYLRDRRATGGDDTT